MRKIKLYIAASLDGFIARPDGNLDWLENPENSIVGEDFGYKDFLADIDVTLMGNNTYKWLQEHGINDPYPSKDNYVFTRTAEINASDFVKFFSGDVPAFVEGLRQQHGKDIWLIGGGEINTLLLNHNLLDEIILTQVPIFLGEGIPLFADTPKETKLKLVNVKNWENGFVQMRYEVQ